MIRGQYKVGPNRTRVREPRQGYGTDFRLGLSMKQLLVLPVIQHKYFYMHGFCLCLNQGSQTQIEGPHSKEKKCSAGRSLMRRKLIQATNY